MVMLPLLRELVERLPSIDRYAPFPGFPGLAEQLFDARRTVAFIQGLQEQEFDLAIQLQGSGVYANPFTLLLGARATAGFIRAGDGPGRLDAARPLPLTGHEIQRVLALPLFLGAEPAGERTDFALWAADHAAAAALLSGHQRPLIGIHAGAQDATRRWPPERFAAAARTLQRRHGGTVVIVGSAAEQAGAEEIAALVGEGGLNLASRTSLPVLGAVLARLAVLVTNDSGPAHIAYALDRPVVTIMGGGDPTRYGPLWPGPFHLLAHPVACRPCPGPTCPIGNACLAAVTVEHVVEAVEALLAAAGGIVESSIKAG